MGAVREFFGWIKQYMIMPFFTSKAAGSIGRILLFVTFSSILFRFWLGATEPPESMVQTMYVLLGYIFGGKILDMKNISAFGGAPTPEPETPKAVVKPAPASKTTKSDEVPADEVG